MDRGVQLPDVDLDHFAGHVHGAAHDHGKRKKEEEKRDERRRKREKEGERERKEKKGGVSSTLSINHTDSFHSLQTTLFFLFPLLLQNNILPSYFMSHFGLPAAKAAPFGAAFAWMSIFSRYLGFIMGEDTCEKWGMQGKIW